MDSKLWEEKGFGVKGDNAQNENRGFFDALKDFGTGVYSNTSSMLDSTDLHKLREELLNPVAGTTEEEYEQLKQRYIDLYDQQQRTRVAGQEARERLEGDGTIGQFASRATNIGGSLPSMGINLVGMVAGAYPLTNALSSYMDAESAAIEASENVLNQGGTLEEAQQAFKGALPKQILTTIPDTIIDQMIWGKMSKMIGKASLGKKAFVDPARGLATSLKDPGSRIATKVAFDTGKKFLGKGAGILSDTALNVGSEMLQEGLQNYVSNTEADAAMGNPNDGYSLRGFADYLKSEEGIETLKDTAASTILMGGVGGMIQSGQYLQRGAETARGIQTHNAVEKMMKEGSLQVSEDARQKLEKVIEDTKGFNPAELATWSDSDIIAEASIIEGQNYRTENKTGEKENISTIRGAVKVLNEISGNEGVVSDIGLSQQASDYLDLIGVADDMREQMFGSTTAKPTTKISLTPETAATMKGEDIKQLPHTQVPLLGRPQPNFTMGEGTAARYTGNPNFTIENQQTPGINTNNIQDITNREVIDMARQTQGDNPYSDNRQRISEEMTRRGLNLGDENREVGSYTGEPYTGPRDVSTQGTVTLNDTTADALASKIFERYKENPKMVGAALDNVMRHAHNPQEVAFARNVAQRVLGRMNGYYGGQTQFDNGVAYAGYTEPQQEVRGEPVPAEGQMVKRRYKKRQPVMPVEQVLGANLTTPTENGTVEQTTMEGGQTNGQTENTRGTEDLRGINEGRPYGQNVSKESLQGRSDEGNLGGTQEGTGNSEQGVLSEQKEESFGKQIFGRIPKALTAAWKGLGCHSNITDWRVVSGKKEYMKLFSDSLQKSINNNRTHGVYVDPMSIQDLDGATIILHKSKKAGLAIDKNGTLHGVFKDPSLNIPKIIYDITLIAREMGCKRMDCYGNFLVHGYSMLGYTPVAKLNFNEDYVEHDDAHVTMLKERPDVYILVRNEDSNEVARNKIANEEYVRPSKEDLESLPTFEDYDGAISYGDDSAQIKQRIGDKFNNETVVWATEDARNFYNEIKGEPQSVLDQVSKRIAKQLANNKDGYGYPFLVELQKNIKNGTNESTQIITKEETKSHVDNINKQIDEYVKPEFEEYTEDEQSQMNALKESAKYLKKTDKAANEQRQAQQKNNQQQQQTKETKQQKPETVQEYLERRDNEIEEEVEREEQAATVDKNKNTTETKNANKPMTKQESRAYIRKTAQERGMLKVAQKETTQQKPVVQKEKTESDNVIDGWIEKLTSEDEFNFNDASVRLYKLLDKGQITEKEYDKIMNGLMEYAENQEEVSSKKQEEESLSNSEFLKQSKPKEKSTNSIYESLTEQEKKKVDSVNNVDGIKNLSEHGKIVFFEALQRFKQAKSKLVSKLDVENAIVFARMCERVASLYNREANLGKTYNAKMVADQITIELDVINNEDYDYGESGIIWDGETPTLKSVTDRIIRIFSKPSPTTFIHEATHIYDWELELIAKESPNGQAAKDLQALRKWARYTGKERELNNVKNITSGQQQVYIDLIDDIENAKSEDERKNALRKWEKEKVARGFEEYLRTKQAPVSGLNNVFKRFKNWIASFWNDMRGLSVTPSKEVQEVFDRMIMTDKELREKYGNSKISKGDNQNGRRVVEGANTRNEETLQHKEGSRRSNERNTGLNGTRELDQGGTQGTRSNTETKPNDRQNRKRGTKNKTLTDEQIEAMDRREEKEYQKRQERIENADNAGELSDKLKDVYSVTFTKSAQEYAENRTRMEYFDNREKYWNREEKDGNVTYTRKTQFDHHQKEMTYDGANGYTKEDRKKSKPAEWVEWLKDRIIKYAFNDMHFLAKAARKLGVYDAYVEMAVTKGYALKANTAMQKGIKYNGKYTRALNDIIKDIGEEKQKNFIEYCIAKRILDLSNTELRDMPQYQDMKPDEAKKIIEKYENGADAKLFMKNQKDFVEYNHALLHVLVDGGIISQEEFDALVKRDPNFVPLAKIMDDPDFGFGSIQAARSIVNVKTPIKRIGTSFRKIKNPFLEMQKRTAEYYAIASRNKAGQIFVNKIAGALDKKANGDMIEKGQGMIRKVEVDEVTGEKITKPDDKQQIIYISNNGKQEFYQVSDSEIYHALKALDADQMGTIQKMIDPFLHAPSALIRETATMVPDFGVRNLIRDGGEAFLTSEHGFLPLIDQIWGMYQMANNTEWYQHFLEQQGEYGTRTRERANMDNFAKIEDTIDDKVSLWKNFQEIRRANWNTLTNKKKSKTQRAVALLTLMGSIPYAFMKSNKRINEYLEFGTRIGEFKNAKMGYNGTLDRLSKGGILDWDADIKNAKGMSDVLAAGKAKEITLNFQQHGIVGKQLNRYIPFFNATLQGIYKLCNALELMATGRTLSGEKNRTLQGEILFKAALVTAIGIGVAAAGEGDDDYEQANQYEKENFWILPNGLRFPKDQVLGKLFGNVAEKSYTQWRKGKFEPSDILRSILENFTPDKFMPALAEIALGGIYNYDTFYKSAIVPEYMEGKLGHLQKDLATSNMAVDISNALWKYFHADVSAKRLDWALQKNFTNVKKYVDSLYDLGFSDNEKMARGYDKSDATGEFVGALKDNKIPIINKVTGTFATNRTNYKSISDFYSKYNELKRLATDEPSMSKEEKRQWKRYEQAYKKDKNFRKQLRAIKQDKSLTGAQKREKADKIFKQQIKLAKWAEG